MTAPAIIHELVERFDRDPEQIRRTYNEAQLRREFVDPLFEALGWDVQNRNNAAPRYRQVIHEDTVLTREGMKAPDYGFRFGETTKFYVETKAPQVNLQDYSEPAYQLRRYGWNKRLDLSILTNFAEFAVYDCRIKPNPKDDPKIARRKLIPYSKYLVEWDWLAETFSPDGIRTGKFDQFAGTKKGHKGTAQVDEEFLQELEAWREHLAHNIALRNKQLTQPELNFVVQRTIDRIVFLRVCEDRGTEPLGQLQELKKSAGVYARLHELFRRADERYNSGLFHFHKEKGREEEPDTITRGITMDDKVLREIIDSLYYPAPYEFSVFPPDILGQVYERFLGKVIRLTPSHTAKVEEKPEVKKAGGVYYTPTYIVDYIVKHTVGKLVEGKTPDEVSKLRILDPACGSGSFLIGAYQSLLDWHRDWYVQNSPPAPHNPPVNVGKGPEKSSPRKRGGDKIMETASGFKLTLSERRRILLNNIYGVDIDSQAVEVTKLSLLLKVLEGESEESVTNQTRFDREAALPDLGKNIKCGNSLIGPDIWEHVDAKSLTKEEHDRLNPFDWKEEFKEVFKQDGFDAVIGNPPYIRIQTMKEWTPRAAEYFGKTYSSAAVGNYDIYVVFVEKGLDLLSGRGRLGFILPHKFFNAHYGENLRKRIAHGKHLEEVVHFGDNQVFYNATTYTCLMILKSAGIQNCRWRDVNDITKWRATDESTDSLIPALSIGHDNWSFASGAGHALLEKLRSMTPKLEDVTQRIFQGLKTSADKIYIVEEKARKGKLVKVFSRMKEAEYEMESTLLHPLVKGGDSKRYFLREPKLLILFPYASSDSGFGLLPQTEIKNKYPLTWKYLSDNRAYLENRENGKIKGDGWYAFGRSQALDVIGLPKIFTPDLAAHATYSLDETGRCYFTGGAAGGYGILVNEAWSRSYVLGLLNSNLLDWFVKQTATRMRGGYYSFEARFIRGLPIRAINFSDKKDKARHDKMVTLVERMLTLHKELAGTSHPDERTRLEREIAATDKQIDRLVYELYDLTPEEIAIVEGENKG